MEISPSNIYVDTCLSQIEIRDILFTSLYLVRTRYKLVTNIDTCLSQIEIRDILFTCLYLVRTRYKLVTSIDTCLSQIEIRDISICVFKQVSILFTSLSLNEVRRTLYTLQRTYNVRRTL